MDSILKAVGNWLIDGLDAILDPFLGGIFRGLVKILLNLGICAYNGLANCSIDLLKQTPQSWSAGVGWSVALSVNDIFIAIGATLAVIFWCIGMIKLSTEERVSMKVETVIKPLIKLTAAELLITNSVTIISVFFGLVNNVINRIVPGGSVQLSIPADVNSQIESAGVVESLAFALVAVFFLIAAVAAGGSILYFAYIRFFKVLLIIPYGALSSTYVAGGQGISHGTLSYYKYVLSVSFEAVTMMLGLRISMAIISSDAAVNITANATDAITQVCLWMVRAIILMFVTLGAVKESSQITQRGFGM